MPRFWTKTVLTALVCLMPVVSGAQGRTAGQIVGTVKDASGAVVPKAELILIDNGTGTTNETRSGADGNFVFPNLQPGRYQITATFQGFNPVTIQEVVVETARSVNLVVQFEVAGLTEQVRVEGRSQVVETTSTTIANTVSNEQISKLPLAGRNILNFALLVPGSASSAGARDSEYNGLPGGAINITLDGVNNNSARFRSGGTSFFTFAPIRMGAIEEVTISTAGLTADAGAEGAVQIQFVTKRGTNAFRGQVFDQISERQAQRAAASSTRRAACPRPSCGSTNGAPTSAGPSSATSCSSSPTTSRSTRQARSTQEPQRPEGRSAAGHLPLQRDRQQRANGQPAGHRARQRPAVDHRSVRRDAVPDRQLRPRRKATWRAQTLLLRTRSGSSSRNRRTSTSIPTARVDYQASPSLAIRGVLNLQCRDLPTQPAVPGTALDRTTASPRPTTSCRPAPTGRSVRISSIK